MSIPESGVSDPDHGQTRHLSQKGNPFTWIDRSQLLIYDGMPKMFLMKTEIAWQQEVLPQNKRV